MTLRSLGTIARALLLLPALMGTGSTRAAAQQPALPVGGAATGAYGRLPLQFEANRGQVAPDNRFLARGQGYDLAIRPTEAVLSLRRTADRRTTLRMRLLGANASAAITAEAPLPGKVHYFIGNDPKQWHTSIPTSRKVRVADVYPGVDLVYYGSQRRVQYDFVVAPGADARRIALAFEGASQARLAGNGDLIVSTAGGDLRKTKPVCYQDYGGRRVAVPGRFVLKKATGRSPRVSFQVARHDRSRPLVIDPVLDYSTYLGGTLADVVNAVTTDATGAAYVVGATSSVDFPVTPSAFQPANAGGQDAFVAKLSPDGSSLVYCTYIGSTYTSWPVDSANAIAVDQTGCAYVGGSTRGGNGFPTTPGALQTTASANCGFVTKLAADGGSLVYSTLLGGRNSGGYSASVLAITADAAGRAYVTGGTNDALFPVTDGAFQRTHTYTGNSDVFVSCINAAGTGLLYSTFLGGRNEDTGFAIVVDSAGNAYVAGTTTVYTTPFPTTPGAFQKSTDFGNYDVNGFVTKLNSGGTGLLYSTLLGGVGEDVLRGLAVDQAGYAYVTGITRAPAFPTTTGVYQNTLSGTQDAFVTKLNLDGTGLVYSTYLGNTGSEDAYGIALAVDGTAWIAGWTNSFFFPTTADALQGSYAGGHESFLTRLNPDGTGLLYSSFFGGIGNDEARCLALDPAGRVYVAGLTASTDLPTTTGAVQPANAGGTSDGFVMRMSFGERETTALATQYTMGCIGETVDLVATLTRVSDGVPLAGRQVAFSVAGTHVGTVMTDGIGDAVCPFTIPASLGTGDKAVTVTFGGDGMHLPATATDTLTVWKAAMGVFVLNRSAQPGLTVKLVASLFDLSAWTWAPYQNIAFSVAGTSIGSARTDRTGAATRAYSVPDGALPDSYVVTGEFAGDAIREAAAGSATLTIVKRDVRLVVTPVPGAIGQTVSLTAILTRAVDGAPLVGRGCMFTVDGDGVGLSTTDASGTATIAHKIPEKSGAGARVISVSYAGDAYYKTGAGTGTLSAARAATHITVSDASSNIGETVALNASMTRTTDGGPVVGRTLTFTVDGSAVGAAVTSATGAATLNYALPSGMTEGDKAILVEFAADACYEASSGVGTLHATLLRIATTTYVPDRTGAVGDTALLRAYLRRTSDMTWLAGKTITYVLAGTTIGTAVTDANGRATLTWVITETGGSGPRPFAATFDGETSYKPSSGSGVLRVTKGAATLWMGPRTVTRGQVIALRALLRRTTGNVALAGRSVAFSVDGVSVGSVVTDATGWATLNFTVPGNWSGGDHPVVAEFSGDAAHYGCAGVTVLTVSDL